MKIGVIGTFIRDTIYSWQGGETNSIGGIFFTVAYLANLAKKDVEIWPASFVGSDFYAQIIKELSGYGNLHFDYLYKIDLPNTHVKLTYTAEQEREEITTEPMPPLGFGDIKKLTDADAVIINLITGTDLQLSALKKLKSKSRGLLYLDFHSRTLGIDEKGKRFYRKPPDWQEWISQVDVLQLNENEACTLAECKNEEKFLINFGFEALKINPAVCHITLAEKGSLLFYKKNGKATYKRVNGVRVKHVVDIIGCGDAFEAAYVLKYFENKKVKAATEYAHKVAAANCQFLGSSEITSIKKIIKNNIKD